MEDFISEDDLQTFDGFLRYQAVDQTALSPAELKEWREIHADALRRAAAAPKVGLMKLQPVPNEQKYAVAIEDGSDLWLTMWVKYSRKGEVFIMYPRGACDWDAHASYHRDGRLHQKSHGQVMGRPYQRQPLTAAFKGTEHLGMYSGHGGRSIGAISDPAMFTGVVTVGAGVLGPKDGWVSVDLVEPGLEPEARHYEGRKIATRQVFPQTGRPSLVITVGW